MLTTITVRPQSLDDLARIPALLRRVYKPPLHGPEAIWPQRSLLQHLSYFPEGQLVAETEDGKLVGTSTALRTTSAKALAPHTWMEITGGGSLASHDPEGDVLYGVNIAVDPDHQSSGVGRALYDARLRLARELGCSSLVAGARIPGYGRYAHELSPEAYVRGVVLGHIFDPTLSKQLRVGFEVLGVLRDYAPDPETLGHAALIRYRL
jgi:ribosomal protein S18 acetylase RimI-like enzyme